MTAPKDTIYPDMLKIRDTGIHEDSGRRIHTTAGMGYPRKEYVRTDLVEALEAENQRLREALARLYDEFGCSDDECDICAQARAALRNTEASHDD